MIIDKVQYNKTTFGTKVKMNPLFINRAIANGDYTRLRNQIKILEENGCNDILSINQVFIPTQHNEYGYFGKVYAEVYEINGDKLKMSNTVESPTYEVGSRGGWHFPNIVELYEKAKPSLCKYNTYISKWIDYI